MNQSLITMINGKTHPTDSIDAAISIISKHMYVNKEKILSTLNQTGQLSISNGFKQIWIGYEHLLKQEFVFEQNGTQNEFHEDSMSGAVRNAALLIDDWFFEEIFKSGDFESHLDIYSSIRRIRKLIDSASENLKAICSKDDIIDAQVSIHNARKIIRCYVKNDGALDMSYHAICTFKKSKFLQNYIGATAIRTWLKSVSYRDCAMITAETIHPAVKLAIYLKANPEDKFFANPKKPL